MQARSLKFFSSFSCTIVCLSVGFGQTVSSPNKSQSTSGSGEKPGITFHAETRLVVVDVVVTGHHQEPVTGLTKSDFTVLEDGEPQQILFFEAHVPPSGQALAPLPPHQYTNVSTQSPSAVNIVLFDALNTPLEDQAYARAQMLRLLKTLPAGQTVALFELGAKLRMIAGFTTRSEDLVAAASKIVAHRSETLDSPDEREEDNHQLALMREGSRNQEFFDHLQEFMDENWAARDQNRAALTLKAFSELAQDVSNFRGRKNVLWLSEEFPVYFGPEVNRNDPHPNLQSYTELTRDTEGMMSSAQMSIYPIDVRGLVTGGLANASSGSGPPGSGRIVAIESLHIAMDELAKQTGGRAFYNTNDLTRAMERSLENGSHYYTIAYAPRNKNWNSKYRRIKIHLANSGLDAEYRKGYYATPERQPPQDQARADLLNAIQPTTPQSTMLQLRARVLPPDGDHTKVRIDCLVDPANLFFTDGPGNHKSARLEFVAVAWDKNLKAAVNATHTVELDLPSDKYENAMHNGIAAHQELKLQPGSYIVSLGIMDDASRRIGTLHIPIQVDEAKTSAKPK
jgi:VWFA-related protein